MNCSICSWAQDPPAVPTSDLSFINLTRATGAMLGIPGRSAEEYVGVGSQRDADGRPFDGAHRYTIRFGPDALPDGNMPGDASARSER